MHSIARILLAGSLVAASAWGQAQGPFVESTVKRDSIASLRQIFERVGTGAAVARNGVIDLLAPAKGAGVAYPSRISAAPTSGAVQKTAAATTSLVFGLNMNGIGADGIAPPDATLGVGATQVVEWVNVRFAIYSKSTGSLLLGPVNGNVLWSGFGGVCESANSGGPMVQWDRMAQRWVMTQHAYALDFRGNPAPPYTQCIAVSQTADATGGWYRYAYVSTDPAAPRRAQFNDAPKLGIWPDGYYMSFNMFDKGLRGFTAAGSRVCAFDRTAMLAGAAAASVCFQLAGFYSQMPGDLDGATLPPTGAAAYVLSSNWWFETDPANSRLQLQRFKVNWSAPASSTFGDGYGGATGSYVALPTPGMLATCNNYDPAQVDAATGACIVQPNTPQKLDTLSPRPMYRLAYRNFGDREALVTSFAVDPDGAGPTRAAVRWMEIRNPGGNPPTVFQDGVFSPDAASRWMSSATMDKQGNIAVGYSAASETLQPAIRITGRLRSEPKNLLQGEATVFAGTGSQTASLNRWGDYVAMQIDPTDDCTFWFTGEYIPFDGTFNWATRIVAVKFPGCQ